MSSSLQCALQARPPCTNCAYCLWQAAGGDISRIAETDFPVALIETKRLSVIRGTFTTSSANGAGNSAPLARCLGRRRPTVKRQRVELTDAAPVSVGMQRLHRFIRLMRHLDSAPWASVVFSINDRMIRRLTASHLHLIVGKENMNTDRAAMYNFIDPELCLDSSQNLVWITNRQQGKTSTLGKFIAALSIASPTGGSLANVYSTSLDRAIELTKSAKQYVTWMQSKDGAHHEWRSIKFVRNNYNAYSIQTSVGGPINEVASKPKNPDSCRGDAPSAAFFDEIGFIEEKFWYQFALPLLQVTARVATCTTTPPPTDGFFATFVEMIRKRNDLGDHFFTLENHSLSCAACIENMEAHQCCHNLHYVPPWKSLMRFVAMRQLIPKKQLGTFQKEVYGVLSVDPSCYFPKKLVDAFVGRPRAHTRPRSGKVPTVWVGIDPASHSVSEMGICAIQLCPDTGMVQVLGLASVPVAQCEVSQIQALVTVFLKRLRANPLVNKLSPLVPCVECNNNEVYAMSIGRVFAGFRPVWMPFTADRFRSHIVPGIGVTTTHANKQSMVVMVYEHLLDGRLVLTSPCVTCSRADLDPRLTAVPICDTIQLFSEQLKRMKDDPDSGEITGKTTGGDNDDLAMALMFTVYWSLTVRATEPDC